MYIHCEAAVCKSLRNMLLLCNTEMKSFELLLEKYTIFY